MCWPSFKQDQVDALFTDPDKAREFDLIYRSRFERLLEQNLGVQCDRALRKARLRPEGGDHADS